MAIYVINTQIIPRPHRYFMPGMIYDPLTETPTDAITACRYIKCRREKTECTNVGPY